jgi:hypothetical protein
MICPTTMILAHGNSIPNSQSLAMIPRASSSRHAHSVALPTTPSNSNPLERLSQLMLSNDRLMDELSVGRAKIVAARTYLDRPGSNARFGSAHLERCRSHHSGVLAQLRANRIEALHLLGHEDRND